MNRKQNNNGISPKTAEASILNDKKPARELRLLAELEQQSTGNTQNLQPQPEIITEFAKLPQNLVFSENTHYKLLNRDSGKVFFISGRVLEGKIGLDSALYQLVKSRTVKAFEVGEHIVAFYQSVGFPAVAVPVNAPIKELPRGSTHRN